MICFDKDDTRFNYRIAGIAIHNEHVLLNRLEETDFWFLPGGRAELRETSLVSLEREMREELGEEVNVQRLVWIAETFFQTRQFYHELALYFLMAFTPTSPIYQQNGPFFGLEEKPRLIYQWFPLRDLASITLKPAFLITGLQSLPASPTHILDRTGV